jgi:hypothetical protein
MLKPRGIGADEAAVLRQIAIRGEPAQAAVPVRLPRIEQCFDRDTLASLRDHISRARDGQLSRQAFKDLLMAHTDDAEAVDQVYRMVDVKNTGVVTFSSFAAFLLSMDRALAWAEETNATKLVLRNDLIAAPRSVGAATVHRDAIACLCYVPKPQQILVTGGLDGQVRGVFSCIEVLHFSFISYLTRC